MSTENMIKSNSTNSKATLKRKVGYVDEEASMTRTKFAQMEITPMQVDITKANENEGESGSSTAHKLSLPSS